MPRPRSIIPTAHLHIKLEQGIRDKMDELLFSSLENRVPQGAHKALIERLLLDFFAGEEVEVAPGLRVRGSASAVAEVRLLMEAALCSDVS